MKWLTLTALVLAGFSAEALTLNKKQLLNPKTIQMSLKNGGGSSPGNPGPVQPIPVIPPTRMGRMKFDVVKTQTVKEPDGSYSFSTVPVCTGEVDMPVWDIRNVTEGYFSIDKLHECDTTYDGQPVKVGVYGYLWISDRQRFNEVPHAEKAGSGGLTVTTHSTPMVFADNPGTRDLANRSLIGGVSQQIQVCTPVNDGSGDVTCEINVGEYFSVGYELIDNP